MMGVLHAFCAWCSLQVWKDGADSAPFPSPPVSSLQNHLNRSVTGCQVLLLGSLILLCCQFSNSIEINLLAAECSCQCQRPGRELLRGAVWPSALLRPDGAERSQHQCSPDSLTHHSQQRAVTHAHCARVEAPQSNMALSSGPAFLQSGRQSSQTLVWVIENQLPHVIWWSLLGRLICRSYLIGSIVLRKNSSKIYPFKMVMLCGYRGHLLLLFLNKTSSKERTSIAVAWVYDLY